jgi:hypothetical protein
VFTKRTGINAPDRADHPQLRRRGGAAAGQRVRDLDAVAERRRRADPGDLLGLVCSGSPSTRRRCRPTRRGGAADPPRRPVPLVARGGGVVDDFGSRSRTRSRPGPVAVADPPSNFPDLMEYGDDQVKVTGSIPKRVLAAADIDALLAASTFAAKARWKTPKVIGATTYPYSMWIEMPACQLVGRRLDDAIEQAPVRLVRLRGRLRRDRRLRRQDHARQRRHRARHQHRTRSSGRQPVRPRARFAPPDVTFTLRSIPTTTFGRRRPGRRHDREDATGSRTRSRQGADTERARSAALEGKRPAAADDPRSAIPASTATLRIGAKELTRRLLADPARRHRRDRRSSRRSLASASAGIDLEPPPV